MGLKVSKVRDIHTLGNKEKIYGVHIIRCFTGLDGVSVKFNGMMPHNIPIFLIQKMMDFIRSRGLPRLEIKDSILYLLRGRNGV